MTSQDLPSLPASSGHVTVKLLDGGSFTANLNVLHQGSASVPYRCHSWAFFIHHEPSGRHILWDVGLSADRSEYTAYTNKHVLNVLHPVSPVVSLPEQLHALGVLPDTLDTVIFSHHHWDHSRPIKGMFPRAVGYFGPGTFAHCTPGQFHDDPYDVSGKWDAHFFHPERSTENCVELDGKWQRFGPFERAMDLLHDGSLWIIQAPGHMPGNLAAAAKLANGEWVIMASDCCHSSRALLDGSEDFRTWVNSHGETESLHEDLPAAKDTVKKLKGLETHYNAHIALAHDRSWILAESDEVLMSLLSDYALKACNAP
ncbi:beta-lactamase-like protein [Ilyonectria sp. MPI-CAGE-AT-0026]|nr:beta-lactamase-like protein [Ilyonectria sp. MPI-CAGE-AT-0026]